MSALEKQFHTGSRYPENYVRNIRTSYQTHNETLKKLADVRPIQSEEASVSFDLVEEHALRAQEKLLGLGACVTPSSLDEAVELLKLWHQAAILDVSDDDIPVTDKIIRAVFDYFEANQAA